MATVVGDGLHDSVMIGKDGRRIAWREGGDRQGRPLVALHGLPGSRLKFDVASEHARTLAIRLISPDRWGYGETDPHPQPSLRGYAEDIEVLADHLALERFSVMGVSGGGPYAAAVAACLPDRITSTALVAPVGPIAGEDDREIDAFHRFCFGPFARNRRARERVFAAFRSMMLASPRLAMAVAMARVPAVDRRVLRGDGVSERLARTFAEGLRRSAHGPVTDMQLFGQPWDIPFERVTAPSGLWLGGKDRSVPASAARRLAARLPDCTVFSLPDEGHLWIAQNYAEVLKWVVSMEKSAVPATP